MKPKNKVSEEAFDWGSEAMEEVEAYKAANPDWESKLKTLDQFRKEIAAQKASGH